MIGEMESYQNLTWNNKNRIFNFIREEGAVSASMIAYELRLSRPTVKKCLEELAESKYIYESGSIGHTGGRRASAYSVSAMSKVAVGVDLTKNHITVIVSDLCGDLIYAERLRCLFSASDEYLRQLGDLVQKAINQVGVSQEVVLGVGIAVPGLITEDYQEIFYGKILSFTGMTAKEIGKYIPYPCRLYNDANAGGYAEVSRRHDISDAFYISLSNNIGGSILIDHKVYHGEGPRSGEVGHVTIIPDGRPCYCGQKGCFETYCNSALLADMFDGNLNMFFEKLKEGDPECKKVWESYLKYLTIAVNNVRMLFDCKVILGGYVGAYMDDYLEQLKAMAGGVNSFEDNADYLEVCQVKKEALALGSALPFIHELWRRI